MKLAIMQPYFFPYIGYWQLIKSVDKFILYDDVNYKKRGWINRNNILMNGEVKRINLKLNGASQNKLINDITVLNDKRDNGKLLKMLEYCYKKAAYFEYVFPIIEDIINQEENILSNWLEYSIRKICKYLLIDTEIIVSSTISKNNELNGQNKILEICKIIGASEYYNAIGGKTLYSYEDFQANGIKLKFLQTEPFEYVQFDNVFVPNLSIIDVIMFNSKEEVGKMLNLYKLV